jgi:uncharacterized protein (DUF1778 family)
MINKVKDKMITLRVSSEDYRYFQMAAFVTGQTPSKLLRLFMDSSINAVKLQISKGTMKIEDFQALLDNKL